MYYSNGIGSIYDPRNYPEGVPNPYTPRVHAWGGGPWPSEGTRFHGPVYTRPQWGQPYNWIQRPMNGLSGNPFVQPILEVSCPGNIPATQHSDGSYSCLVANVPPAFVCDGEPATAREHTNGTFFPVWRGGVGCQRDTTTNQVIAAVAGVAAVGAGIGLYFLLRK
jgi:hypothetical protein